MLNLCSLILLSLLLQGCFATKPLLIAPQSLGNCQYENIHGKNVFIGNTGYSLLRWQYDPRPEWDNQIFLMKNNLGIEATRQELAIINTTGTHQRVRNPANVSESFLGQGRFGKLITISHEYNRRQYQIVFEDCTAIYSANGTEPFISEYELYGYNYGLFKPETIDNLKRYVGQKRYVRRVFNSELELYKNGREHTLPNFTEVTFSGIEFRVDPSKTRKVQEGALFYFQLTTQNGEHYILPIYENYLESYKFDRDFVKENPINDRWEISIIEAIKSGSVIKGMTREQVKLSLGTPTEYGYSGETEIYVYSNISGELLIGSNTYIYLANGYVTRREYSTVSH